MRDDIYDDLVFFYLTDIEFPFIKWTITFSRASHLIYASHAHIMMLNTN
jgi:hypothetical protein